jgi:hypothetical protein
MHERTFHFMFYSPPIITVWSLSDACFCLILTISRARPTLNTLLIVTILQCELRLQYAGNREYTHLAGNLGATLQNHHSGSIVGCLPRNQKNLHRQIHWRRGRHLLRQSHNFRHLLPHPLCIQAIPQPHLHPRLHRGRDPVRQAMPLLYWAPAWKMNLQGLVHCNIFFLLSVLYFKLHIHSSEMKNIFY